MQVPPVLTLKNDAKIEDAVPTTDGNEAQNTNGLFMVMLQQLALQQQTSVLQAGEEGKHNSPDTSNGETAQSENPNQQLSFLSEMEQTTSAFPSLQNGRLFARIPSAVPSFAVSNAAPTVQTDSTTITTVSPNVPQLSITNDGTNTSKPSDSGIVEKGIQSLLTTNEDSNPVLLKSPENSSEVQKLSQQTALPQPQAFSSAETHPQTIPLSLSFSGVPLPQTPVKENGKSNKAKISEQQKQDVNTNSEGTVKISGVSPFIEKGEGETLNNTPSAILLPTNGKQGTVVHHTPVEENLSAGNQTSASATATEVQQRHSPVTKQPAQSSSSHILQTPLQRTRDFSEVFQLKRTEETAQSQVTGKAIVEQIVHALSVQIKENKAEVRVMLQPESLGEILVKVKMEKGTMHAEIDVTNPTTKAILEVNLPQLRDVLTTRGIEMQRIEIVSSYQAGTGTSEQRKDLKESKSKHSALGEEETPTDEEQLRNLGYNTMEITL